MPTKDELVQRYNRMNTIPQVMTVASRLLKPLDENKEVKVLIDSRDFVIIISPYRM